MSIDKRKVKAGDKVKIQQVSGGVTWQTPDWVEVEDAYYGVKIGSYHIENVDVIDHKPNLKPLEDALEAAKIEAENAAEKVTAAKLALENAKRERLVGRNVSYSSISNGIRYGVIERILNDNRLYCYWADTDSYSTETLGRGGIVLVD